MREINIISIVFYPSSYLCYPSQNDLNYVFLLCLLIYKFKKNILYVVYRNESCIFIFYLCNVTYNNFNIILINLIFSLNICINYFACFFHTKVEKSKPIRKMFYNILFLIKKCFRYLKKI